MDLFKDFKTIAIVGLEKNTGKTETFNFLLNNLQKNYVLGITSIGIDGEDEDQVTHTKKPNIFVDKGVIFVTTEKFYKQKNFLSEILYVSTRSTSTGRIIIAKALEKGKIILSGPTTMKWLSEINLKLFKLGVDKILIDGALSRISSSTISDALILATGAAISLDIEKIVEKTSEIIYKINLPKYPENIEIKPGIFSKEQEFIESSLLNIKNFEKLKKYKEIIISGALTESFLKNLINKNIYPTLIVKDISKIFVKSFYIKLFQKKGGKIFVTHKPNLILITVNPYSPYGYKIDEETLIKKLSKETSLPIINVRKVEKYGCGI
ncbi:hypothetical protein SU69_01030 [Thermosipho melanesiensis]|nr:hypothetical protein SU68_01030 [Thermosipho melanesiensis]OOC40544.1 hypothetical protein SU70_01030 [Thermosipho melanesiensis]OOC40807.1 hypothetical protein SU69_01030 [Thermosipho melanesiensis]OOC44654.1 hypothetical protein SU71_01020 [Thermosipho melanesiensis]OOC46008.1 hypothetical protein SU72_01020 [Thermosipho melanesiensis]